MESFGGNAEIVQDRNREALEVQVDASHAPLGGRSQHACVILYRGAPIAWDCGRQSITALSSAESEIIGGIHGMQLGECVLPVIAEMTDVDPEMVTL